MINLNYCDGTVMEDAKLIVSEMHMDTDEANAAHIEHGSTLRPWVQMFANPLTAQAMRALHPMRFNKKIFSEQLNPFMWNVEFLAEIIAENRKPTSVDNVFAQAEHAASKQITKALNDQSETRDQVSAAVFKQLF